MDIADVMDEIAARLDTIEPLRVIAHWPGSISPPTAIVALPDTTFDETYGRGMDRLQLPVVLAVGKVVDRSARDAIAAYVNGSGPKSVKQVVESGTYTAFDTVRVMTAEFDTYIFGAVEHLVAIFQLDIAGDGA